MGGFIALEEENEVVAKRLKLLRVENGFTQTQISKKLEISQQSYSNYEKNGGGFDCDVLRKLCRLYGVTADYILGMDENRESATEVKELSETKMIKLFSKMDKLDEK